MTLAESLLPEFDQEIANTRKMLEAVPNDQLAFKPHEKSCEMAALITHLTMLPDWGKDTLTKDGVDFTGFVPPAAVKSREEAIERLDKHATDARQALAATTDAAFFQNWSLSGNGQVFFTMPRIAVFRSFVMNHLIHHRAQLAIYIRCAGGKVPGMYGPSADETM